MKFLHGSLLLSALAVSSCRAAIQPDRKQNGSPVIKENQIKKPNRNTGNAIIIQLDQERDTASFKISQDDLQDARVAIVSDDGDIEYCVIHPGQSTCKSIKQIKDEGNQVVEKVKEKINGNPVHSNAIKFNNKGNKFKKGGVLKIKAEKPKNKDVPKEKKNREDRSLAESATVVILNPTSPLNVCYETESLINYVGEPLGVKISLCNVTSGDIQNDGDNGIVSGSLKINGDTPITIPPSDEDGFSVVSFTPDTVGIHSVDIDIEASYGEEVFDRQATGWLITVTEKQLDSVISASLDITEGESGAVLAVKFALADGYVPSVGDAFIIHADIVDSEGEGVVTASTIADLEDDNTLQVVIQRDWFTDKYNAPFYIEYLRISSEDEVPLIITGEIPINVDTKQASDLPWARRLSESPEERELRMTHGVPPPQSRGTKEDHGNGNLLRRQLQDEGTKVITSHGYCSSDAWKNYLPGTYKFADYKQNRSHREFAQLLVAFGDSYESGGSCSIIAHSQGGAASLYLYTYYWSCLDNGPSRRLIQSVGTPYEGTGVAGNVAFLGSIFGVGCGRNYDLTEDGSRNFLADIPFNKRSKVFYYSTSFETRFLRYDYCSAATDLFLSDPEDGVVRKVKAQLPGGNNMGHTEGQCHSANMRDPPQTSDRIKDGSGEKKSTRNEEMLRYAQTA